MDDPHDLLEEYLRGPEALERGLEGVAAEQLDERPIPGTWTIRQVICHLTDAEIVYAERFKRVLVEENPTLFDWSPDLSVLPEFCDGRDPAAELALMKSLRQYFHTLLTAIDVESWQRTAVHSADGPVTLETLLERITHHIPHHIRFIEQKKAALGVDA